MDFSFFVWVFSGDENMLGCKNDVVIVIVRINLWKFMNEDLVWWRIFCEGLEFCVEWGYLVIRGWWLVFC